MIDSGPGPREARNEFVLFHFLGGRRKIIARFPGELLIIYRLKETESMCRRSQAILNSKSF